MVLNGESPGGIAVYEIEAPVHCFLIDIIACEHGRDEVMVRFEDWVRDSLAFGTDILEFVDAIEFDCMFRYFGAACDPINGFGCRLCAIGFDDSIPSSSLEHINK
jgi:hypothetical protein